MVEKDIKAFARELGNRFISVHGDIKSIDEVIDDLLNNKDDKKKRRLATG